MNKSINTLYAVWIDTCKVISNHTVIVLLSWLVAATMLIGITSLMTIWTFVISAFTMFIGLYLGQYLYGNYE